VYELIKIMTPMLMVGLFPLWMPLLVATGGAIADRVRSS
jgi:hypothetical protein